MGPPPLATAVNMQPLEVVAVPLHLILRPRPASSLCRLAPQTLSSRPISKLANCALMARVAQPAPNQTVRTLSSLQSVIPRARLLMQATLQPELRSVELSVLRARSSRAMLVSTAQPAVAVTAKQTLRLLVPLACGPETESPTASTSLLVNSTTPALVLPSLAAETRSSIRLQARAIAAHLASSATPRLERSTLVKRLSTSKSQARVTHRLERVRHAEPTSTVRMAIPNRARLRTTMHQLAHRMRSLARLATSVLHRRPPLVQLARQAIGKTRVARAIRTGSVLRTCMVPEALARAKA